MRKIVVFLRKSKFEPLPVSMCGVRMGERVLQVGVDEASLVGALAAKAGLSGQASVAVADEAAAAKVRGAGENAGVLLDVRVTPPHTLPFDGGAFDVAVVHGVRGLLSALDEATGLAALRELHRVLRQGGRLVIIEPGPGGGLGAMFRSKAPGTTSTAALATAGFKATRVLAEREGYTFTEGLKS